MGVYVNEMEEKMTAEEFGEFLMYMREMLGFSQKEMSDLLGVKSTTYNAYEKGKRLPKNWESVERLLKDKVCEHVKKLRETPDYVKEITEELGKKIIEMHKRGKNIVQIGTRLDIDEEEVEKFLKERGYEPIPYFPGWLDSLCV